MQTKQNLRLETCEKPQAKGFLFLLASEYPQSTHIGKPLCNSKSTRGKLCFLNVRKDI